LAGHFDAPHPGQHGHVVARMISHHVKNVFALEPLLDGLHFAEAGTTIEVSKKCHINLKNLNENNIVVVMT
jgi:hypothetical protein